MRVVLINTPVLDKKGNFTYSVGIPLGLSYIASYLLSKNIEVKVIDAVGEGLNTRKKYKENYVSIGLTNKEIISRIDSKTDIIAVSVKYCTQHNLALNLIKDIKKKFPKKTLVIGGNQGTYHFKEFLEVGVNFAVLGEGELALHSICLYLQKKKKLSELVGVAYKKNGKVHSTKSKFIENLDELPFPARHLFPIEKYAKEKTEFGPTNKISTAIMSSRGCPHQCSYCTSSIFWGRLWRARSPKNVVDEVEECINKYGIRELFFVDDNLTLDKERANKIFKEIIKRNLKIRWAATNGIRAEGIDKNMLELMKKSGCVHLTFAPESGSQRVLKQIFKKNIDLEKIRKAIRMCNKIGINTAAYIIIGAIGETKKDIQLTKKYIKSLAKAGVDEIGIFPLIPYPESDIAKKYELNKIKPEWEELITGIIPKWYPAYEKIKSIKRNLYITFYLTQISNHPKKIFRLFFNFLRGKQETKSDRILRNFMRFLFKHD